MRPVDERFCGRDLRRRLHYIVSVAYRLGDRTHEARYAGHARPSTGTFAVDSTSFEERASPLTPHGINVGIAFGGRTVKDLSAPLPTYDGLCVPELSPVYGFGLSRRASASTPEQADARAATASRM